MKYLVTILIMFFALAGLQAQNKSTYDVILKNDKQLREYRGKTVDTLGVGKTTFTYTFFKDYHTSFEQSLQIGLDSVSGTPANTSIKFQRRKNVFNTWTTDSTVTWYGSTSDTTIVYNDTVRKSDPYRRISVTYGTGFKTKIDWLAGLFVED